MSEFPSLTDAVTNGDAAAAVAAARAALDAGAEPIRLVGEGLGPAMTKVGRLFEEGDCFVPELLMAARATKAVFEILRPLLAQTGREAGRRASSWAPCRATCTTSARTWWPRCSRGAASR